MPPRCARWPLGRRDGLHRMARITGALDQRPVLQPLGAPPGQYWAPPENKNGPEQGRAVESSRGTTPPPEQNVVDYQP